MVGNINGNQHMNLANEAYDPYIPTTVNIGAQGTNVGHNTVDNDQFQQNRNEFINTLRNFLSLSLTSTSNLLMNLSERILNIREWVNNPNNLNGLNTIFGEVLFHHALAASALLNAAGLLRNDANQ